VSFVFPDVEPEPLWLLGLLGIMLLAVEGELPGQTVTCRRKPS
jgi:hypothetical protein